MKTLELKLKKNLLIVDVPEDTKFDVLLNSSLWKDGIKFLTGKEEKFNFIEGKYRFICKGSELTEEIASELVEKVTNETQLKCGIVFTDYKNSGFAVYTAKESFIYAIEANGFYWLENPIAKPEKFLFDDDEKKCNEVKKWQKAEAKTFKNPLIFERI